MAIIPRTQQGHGWLRPAIGVIELSQSMIQVYPDFQSTVKRSQGPTLLSTVIGSNCTSSCHMIIAVLREQFSWLCCNLLEKHEQTAFVSSVVLNHIESFLFLHLKLYISCFSWKIYHSIETKMEVLIFFMQAVPLSSRKATGGSSEGYGPFLQLPHFTESVVKKIARKVSLSLYICMLVCICIRIYDSVLFPGQNSGSMHVIATA